MALAVLALALPAFADTRDQIDPTQIVVHDSPLDVGSWPVTATISQLTMRPGQNAGLSFQTSPALGDSWVVQAFPADHPDLLKCAPIPDVTDGCLQYTVWAVVKVSGQWHAAGFIQMWYGRASTGAPILTDFHSNWAYACDRWPSLCQYIPQAGDQMGFFLTAGNARDYRDVSSVRERTNIVVVSLPAGDNGDFSFAGGDVPTPPVPPVPPTPPTPVVDLTPRVQSLEGAVALLVGQLAAANANVAEAVRLVSAVVARVDALEARKIPTSCKASAFGFGLSCSLQ